MDTVNSITQLASNKPASFTVEGDPPTVIVKPHLLVSSGLRHVEVRMPERDGPDARCKLLIAWHQDHGPYGVFKSTHQALGECLSKYYVVQSAADPGNSELWVDSEYKLHGRELRRATLWVQQMQGGGAGGQLLETFLFSHPNNLATEEATTALYEKTMGFELTLPEARRLCTLVAP